MHRALRLGLKFEEEGLVPGDNARADVQGLAGVKGLDTLEGLFERWFRCFQTGVETELETGAKPKSKQGAAGGAVAQISDAEI